MNGPWVAAFFILTVLVLAIGVLLIGLLRRVHGILITAEKIISTGEQSGPGGLPVGATVPDFEVLSPSGSKRPHSPAETSRGTVIIYLLVDPDCGPCRSLVAAVRDLNESGPLMHQLILLTRAAKDSEDWLTGIGAHCLRHSGTADLAFDAHATPYAFAVSNGTVLSRSNPNSTDDLLKMLSAHGQMVVATE